MQGLDGICVQNLLKAVYSPLTFYFFANVVFIFVFNIEKEILHTMKANFSYYGIQLQFSDHTVLCWTYYKDL